VHEVHRRHRHARVELPARDLHRLDLRHAVLEHVQQRADRVRGVHAEQSLPAPRQLAVGRVPEVLARDQVVALGVVDVAEPARLHEPPHQLDLVEERVVLRERERRRGGVRRRHERARFDLVVARRDLAQHVLARAQQRHGLLDVPIRGRGDDRRLAVARGDLLDRVDDRRAELLRRALGLLRRRVAHLLDVEVPARGRDAREPEPAPADTDHGEANGAHAAPSPGASARIVSSACAACAAA
jgi:hypothetical protein